MFLNFRNCNTKPLARYAGFKIVKTIERGGTAMHPALYRSPNDICFRRSHYHRRSVCGYTRGTLYKNDDVSKC